LKAQINVIYLFKNGEKVGTMVLYGECGPVVWLLNHERLSPWKLVRQEGNKYYFEWKGFKQ